MGWPQDPWMVTRRQFNDYLNMLKYVTVEKRKNTAEQGADIVGEKQNPEKKTKVETHMAEGGGEGAEAASKPATSSTQGSKESGFELLYKKGDLFGCDAGDSLAHCISEDIAMGKGIAVLFKKKFGGIQELKQQGQKPGGCAILKRDSRYIYYLVTKPKYWHKPTYDTLTSSLKVMKKHCVEKSVSCVAMPKIGCGLDKLEWDKVAAILSDVFKDTNIQIIVYTL